RSPVLPQRAQAFRRGQPGPVVLSHSRVDVGGRHAHPSWFARTLRDAGCHDPGSRWARVPGQGFAAARGRGPPDVPPSGRVARSPRLRRSQWRFPLRYVPKVGSVIDAVGNPQSLLVFGGTSDIALATAEKYAAARPLRIVLAARQSDRLDEAA